MSDLAQGSRATALPVSARHTVYEDAIALVLGSLFVALGVAIYGKANLLTGSTVGIALLTSYATSFSFSTILILVNVPFFLLAWMRLGWLFTLKTLAAVGLVALFARLTPLWLEVGHVNVVYAAAIGGGLLGIGLLILFRHGMSLGGVSILAYYLQEKRGWRAGIIQFAADMAVMLAAFAVVTPLQVLLSAAGVAILCSIIGMNHRPDRYRAVS